MKKLLWLIPMVSVCFAKNIEIIEGKHFKKIEASCEKNCNETVRIVEYFSFVCPGCYRVEREIDAWLKNKNNIIITKIPITLDDKQMRMHAKGYYVAKHFDKDKEYTKILFDKVQREDKKMASKEAVSELLESLGISKQDINDAFASFSLEVQLSSDEEKMIRSKVLAMPTLIIGNKYKVNPQIAGGFDNFWQVVDHIVEKVRKENKPGNN